MQLTDKDLARIVRGKMKDNGAIIFANATSIRAQADALLAACDRTSLEEMNNALRSIVDAAIGCRSRLQYMRGCWAVLKEARQEPAVQPNAEHERLD